MKTFSDSPSDLLLQNQGNSPFPKSLNTSMSALIKIPNLLAGIPYRQDHLVSSSSNRNYNIAKDFAAGDDKNWKLTADKPNHIRRFKA